jgi:hypothetical protein
VDEASALGVTSSGEGTVFGAGAGVYFLSVGSPVTRICQPLTALTFTPVTAYRVPVGKRFSITSWTTSEAVPYTLNVAGGVVTSSTGSIY